MAGLPPDAAPSSVLPRFMRMTCSWMTLTAPTESATGAAASWRGSVAGVARDMDLSGRKGLWLAACCCCCCCLPLGPSKESERSTRGAPKVPPAAAGHFPAPVGAWLDKAPGLEAAALCDDDDALLLLLGGGAGWLSSLSGPPLGAELLGEGGTGRGLPAPPDSAVIRPAAVPARAARCCGGGDAAGTLSERLSTGGATPAAPGPSVGEVALSGDSGVGREAAPPGGVRLPSGEMHGGCRPAAAWLVGLCAAGGGTRGLSGGGLPCCGALAGASGWRGAAAAETVGLLPGTVATV